MHNKKVVVRQLKDYYQQEETRQQQQQQRHQEMHAVAIGGVEQPGPFEQEVYQGGTSGTAARLEDHDPSSSAEASAASSKS